MINKAECSGSLMGFACSRGGPRISDLFCVNDSLIFCRAKIDDVAVLKQVLQSYEAVSGQAINMAKSSNSYSPNVETATRGKIENLPGLPVAQSHER